MNQEDNYILGKWKTEVYRFNENTLAIYFKSNQTVGNVIPQLEDLGVKLELYIQGEFEQVFIFSESDLPKLHQVIKFQIKGKNIQAKSVKTVRKLNKKLNK